MKVQIKVTVEVDPAKWADTYGCEVAEVRDDVWSYFINQIVQAQAVENAHVAVRVG